MPNILEKLKPARHIVTKYNSAEFDAMFDGFIRDVDRVIERNMPMPPYQGSDEPTMDDGASVYEPDYRDAEQSDVRPELERYRDQGVK